MGASTKHSEEGTVDEGEKENDARAEDDDAVSVAVDGAEEEVVVEKRPIVIIH